MKARKLQFGKAMSAALFVLLLVVVGTKNALAQNQVATLQHGDDISIYYGANAFVEAHDDAEDGDIITFSSGSFSTPSIITKAITLRGAGAVSDTVAQTNPTIFLGTVEFNVDNDSIPVNVEGILFSNSLRYLKLINPKFTRCGFNEISTSYSSSTSMTGALFVNCIINQFNFYYASNTILINSVVWISNNNNSSPSPVVIYNSILAGNHLNFPISAYNSIIVFHGTTTSYYGSSYLPSSSCSFINCIGINTYNDYNTFGTGYTSGCINYTSYVEVFDSFTGIFSIEEAFILKDEISTTILGSDGTQVGIYGGPVPYSYRPGYMVLKRCNVASQSTVDGKLSVEIEIVTEGE